MAGLPLCGPCLRRGTFNEPEGEGRCPVHLWRWEAAQLAPDFYERWVRGQPGRDGKMYERVPAVLKPNFPLKDCEECGNPILPWKRSHVVKGRGYALFGAGARRTSTGERRLAPSSVALG